MMCSLKEMNRPFLDSLSGDIQSLFPALLVWRFLEGGVTCPG